MARGGSSNVLMAASEFKWFDDILVVGDGNFSYSYDLNVQRNVAAGGAKGREKGYMMATSFDSLIDLKGKYDDAEYYIEHLKEDGVDVIHEVDARNLSETLPRTSVKTLKFDCIIFNFPLVPLTQTAEERSKTPGKNVCVANRNLIWRFIKSSTLLLKNLNSRVFVTSKVCNPYDRWRIASLGPGFIKSVPFDWSSFYHYQVRKVNVIHRSKKQKVGFPTNSDNVRTFIFEPNNVRKHGKMSPGSQEASSVIATETRFLCHICRIECKSMNEFLAHCTGKRHKRLMIAEKKWRIFLIQFN